MKNISRLLFAVLLTMGMVNQGKAEIYHYEKQGNTRGLKQTTAGCSPSSAYEWLDVNNVRTRINAGGDMWWDLPGGVGSKYFVPANGSATSLYAGSLWIAGVDKDNQLKCAAIRFRQQGNDYWTGPLTTDGTASISDVQCAKWDKMFKISRAEVDEFLMQFKNGVYSPEEGYSIPKSISEWPAHGDLSEKQSYYLAPFFDANGDGEYVPEDGDYPYYDLDNELCHTKIPTMEEEKGLESGNQTVHGSILVDQVLKGDQTLWWVFNDRGNSHTESTGAAIGIEVRAQAFGFATNDEINNMTFCSYEIINRSTYPLYNTYFSPWTDVDLGYAQDDYVGCDVARGLGYGYNGSNVDGNGEPESYGDQPPAVGIDFFQGPYMDPDGLDNPKYSYITNIITDSVTGEVTYKIVDSAQICDASINGVNFGNGIVDDERFGMRRFLYHNNDATNMGDPNKAPEYYQMLRGIWKDGNKMQYGGNAYTGSDVVGPACDFMFPGDTDPCNWGTGGVAPNGGYNTNGKYWTEETTGNPPGDRRFMQSAGPFTLEAGAVNYITFGVPWARATSGGAWASVELLRVTDDKCQALFDNCFKVIDGPSAPDLTIRELDQKLIIYLSNTTTSNNYKEGYDELDPEIPEIVPGDSVPADRRYRFEGYKVYQLANNQVGADELNDNSKARLVFQCDIKNNVSRLLNYQWDDHIQANVPSLKVEGRDAGITHSFVITEDKFSSSDNVALVNHKTYYFMAVAYAYNNYLTYSQEPGVANGLYGQMKPYLEGRKNIQCYSAIPHKIVNGVTMRSVYGDNPEITRLVGVGNGGNELELSDETVEEILGKRLAFEDSTVVFGHPDYPIAYHPKYKRGYGPVGVKIIDPLNVVTTDYELWFDTLVEKYTHNVTGNKQIAGDSAARMVSHWYLKDLNTGEVFESDTTTIYADEKMFIERGISVTINQPYEVGPLRVGTTHDSQHHVDLDYFSVIATDNGMINSQIIYKDSTSQWLSGIKDEDLPGSPLDWIRAGTYIDQDDNSNSDFNMQQNKPFDPDQNYEKIAGGTWAPYNLCAFSGQSVSTNPGPVYASASRDESYFKKISSVDIVLTADRSKWTRCPVVEMCMDRNLAEGRAKRFFLRKHASIDKDGKSLEGDYTTIEPSTNPEDPNYIAAQGMGWFPGYVINVETGARLNIVYGEDSYLADLNGRDMMFNPPTLLKYTVDGYSPQSSDPVLFRPVSGDALMGGKHFVYIWGMDDPVVPSSSPYKNFKSPAYDGGKYLYNVMNAIQSTSSQGSQNSLNTLLWKQCMYVGMPMAVEGQKWLPEGNDVRIRIRLAKPYDRGYAGYGISLDSLYPDLDINNLYPKYQFSISGLDPVSSNDPKDEKVKSDLDLITVVPNPYYAYSTYESNALTNTVKIANLPDRCRVTIYSINGTKIRQFEKDNTVTSIDWDLTNHANTPVASGFYLIHIKDYASGGERVIKFFGAMRQVDLNTF